MELGPKELVTFGIVLTGIATTWGVLKATIKSITATLDTAAEDLTSLNQRLDKVEAKQAVAIAAIDTMSKDILSPQILKQQSERDGKVAQRLDSIERELDNIHRMHNGSHPPTQNKTKVS